MAKQQTNISQQGGPVKVLHMHICAALHAQVKAASTAKQTTIRAVVESALRRAVK